ncbi:hypothetical protein ABFT23_02895 [Nocardioides sp. C4-1]|uniref:hypothetical protein n=1 Tax=Nocardioides sp. C4-1 TaxID=3151851 RepID=UPI003267D5AB
MPVRSLTAVALLAAGLTLGSAGGAVAGSMITGKQIKDGTVTSADLKDRTIQVKDLAPSAVAALRGARGATGPAGPAGPAGPTGPTGPQGPTTSGAVSGWVVVQNEWPKPANTSAFHSLTCPDGKRVLGGSAFWVSSNAPTQMAIAQGGGSVLGLSPGVPNADTFRIRITCGTIAP